MYCFLVSPGLPAACWTKYQNEKIALISIILVFREIEMHVFSYTRSSKDSGRVTVLVCVSSDGSDKQVPIVIGKSPKPRRFKNTKCRNIKSGFYCTLYFTSSPWLWPNLATICRRNIKLTVLLHNILCTVLVFIKEWHIHHMVNNASIQDDQTILCYSITS
jgi:hypothetical protein